ncbi:hypothetical protein PAPHI01_1916 [Pancytospora philotis]|nr:hypothetical protein PAPHI01_1916 [Pancytospora philotis]
MNRFFFQILMLLLLTNNIITYNRANKAARKNTYYFFICYTFLYCGAMLLQSFATVPSVVGWLIVATLYLGSVRRCYISKRLFVAIYRFYRHFLAAVFQYRFFLRDLVGILLMRLLSKCITLLIKARFFLFVLYYQACMLVSRVKY